MPSHLLFDWIKLMYIFTDSCVSLIFLTFTCRLDKHGEKRDEKIGLKIDPYMRGMEV